MNRGLTLALFLLIFAVALIGFDTFFVDKALKKNENLLVALNTDEICTEEEIEAVRHAYAKAQLLFSVSISKAYLNEYEEALAALSASVVTREADAYVTARAEALAALAQIKRSALCSVGQIF